MSGFKEGFQRYTFQGGGFYRFQPFKKFFKYREVEQR